MNKFSRFLCGGSISKKTLHRAQCSSFVVINNKLEQYSSFILRIILASVIATGGIAADSTAVIVGSMLIAPLMSPMIGVALAAVLGRPRSTTRALGITIVGTCLSILVSMALAMIIPIGIDTSSNSQIVSRATPRLTDMVIALASSFMASIVIMRDDIPDALAGVAISASIIPPLCVVGVALTQGDFLAAKGSFLLFLTNFFAIQVAGMATFAAMGLGKKAYSDVSRRMKAFWYTLILVCICAVCIPLAVTSNSLIATAMQERSIRETATTWLSGTSYRLSTIHLDDGHVTLEVIGSGTQPSMKALGARLQEAGLEVKDIRMAVVKEQWYRPSVHPEIPEKSAEELELTQKGATSQEELEKELQEEQRIRQEVEEKQKAEEEGRDLETESGQPQSGDKDSSDKNEDTHTSEKPDLQAQDDGDMS